MNTANHAGKTGKSFYAALSLSIAMVGAACWYAFSAAGKTAVPRTQPGTPEQSVTSQTQTTASAPAATTVTSASVTTASTEPAEEAAALLRRTTASSETAPQQPAETTAPVERPIPPIAGELMQPYSAGELVKSPTTGIWATHNGADYAAEIGSEVLAVLDGTVTEIVRDPLWGVCVTLLHADGTQTRYCGLNENLEVMAGQVLERGTVLGTLGDTNETEGALAAHLHFEVLCNDKYADPEAFLSAGA